MRIFPDKLNPNDNPNPANLRQQVNIVAKVDPPVSGVTVYFRVFDVDDPFDQVFGCPATPPGDLGCVTNVSVIDGDTTGRDNRSTGEYPWPTTGTASATIGPDGKARMPFTVSMQPGNNYRAVASQSLAAVNAVTQADADAMSLANPQSPGSVRGCNVPLIWSPMLTVWRRLHVEVDSMGPVDFTNTQNGVVPSAPTYNAANGHAIIPIATLAPEFRKEDQHRPGRIDILTFGSFETIHTHLNSPDTVEILRAPTNIVSATGMPYTLWDDDAGTTAGFVMSAFNAPPVTLPKVPDTSLMASVYKNAYVAVSDPDLQYYQTITQFEHNVPDVGTARARGNANRDLSSSADFWVVHITSAFQGFVDKDSDPDGEQSGAGLQYGISIGDGFPPITSSHSSGSLVYLETIRDHANGNADAIRALERYTVAHESGHQFILEHSDDHAPPDGPAGDYIMTDDTDDSGMAPNIGFSPVSLKKIRSILYPPQP